MPSGNQRADLTILAVLAGASVLVIVALATWGPLRDSQERQTILRTTHSTNTEGVKVYYALLERLGLADTRSERPLDAETLKQLGVLVLLDPLIPLRDDELLALKAWVSQGGVLVFTMDCYGVMHIWDDRAPPPEPSHPQKRTTRDSDSPATSSSPTTATAEEPFLAAHVGEVEFASEKVLFVPDLHTGHPPSTQVLYADRHGPRIAVRPQGKGWLVELADSSFLSNGRIGRADNCVLAANLAAYARWRGGEGPIAFDEYHLGYGVRESGWQAMGFLLFHTSPGWGILVATAAGMLWLVYRGRKFGTRRGITRARRRSKLEYVYSVGETYRNAGAERIVLEQILDEFRRRSSETVGMSRSASVRELAGQLSRRSGRPLDYCQQVLLQCEAAIATPHLSPRRLSDILNGLATLETETLDAHSPSQ